jgi:hypothetical protein
MAGNKWTGAVAVCAALWLGGSGAVVAASAEESAGLRHAVACAPFKGDPALASLYHGIVVEMLKQAAGVEYLEGPRALARRAPEFTFRVTGAILETDEGQSFVAVTLEDAARKEQIASHVAVATTNAAVLASWKKTIQSSMERRAAKLPFECRVRRQQGQTSLTLDRGLGSGLQPGMRLYISMDEELILSQATGEVIGRESPRAVGQIEVFRVMENTAYARPVAETKLPRFSKLYAWTF